MALLARTNTRGIVFVLIGLISLLALQAASLQAQQLQGIQTELTGQLSPPRALVPASGPHLLDLTARLQPQSRLSGTRPASDHARLEEASLHLPSGLGWRRSSPTLDRLDGPVLYTIIIRSSASPNYVPKIALNYTLTNSLIFDNGSSVLIGALAIASDGTISFKSGQTFPGTGTITAVNPGTRLTGGGSSGSVTLGVDAATNTFLNSFGPPAGPNYNGSAGGAATYCVVGQLLLFPMTINGLTTIVPADGRILPIAGNTALFSVLGTNFGGNGTSNFGVPDMRGIAPKNMTYHICVQGTFP